MLRTETPVELHVNGMCFTASHNDIMISKIGRIDGVYLRAHRSLASEVTENLKHSPMPLPAVFDDRINPHTIELRDAASGDLLGVIDGLALVMGIE